MPVRGSDVAVAVYDEVTYGTTTSVTKGSLCYFTQTNLMPKREAVISNTISGDRARVIPGQGNMDVTGNHVLEIAPETIGFWLRHILGAPVTTGASAPYTHTFRNNAALPVGFILEKSWIGAGIASKVEQFLGCRVADATFEFPQSGAATLSMSIVGANHQIASAVLDASLADPGHTGFFAPAVTVKLDGTLTTLVKKASIKVANNLETDRYTLGTGGKRGDLPEGWCDVTGSLTVIVDTTLFSGWLDKAKNRTDTNIEIICTAGAGTGASAGNEKLSIKLDHAMIDENSAEVGSPGGMELTLNFTGYKSGSTDKGLVAVLLSPLADTLIP